MVKIVELNLMQSKSWLSVYSMIDFGKCTDLSYSQLSHLSNVDNNSYLPCLLYRLDIIGKIFGPVIYSW